MPLVYQHTINNNTRLGVWRITEPETFFRERVPLLLDVKHPHKRLQHLAGRYLLAELHPGFPVNEICIADSRKPYLPDNRLHFSISHCGYFAAAIVSTKQQVGIDIEVPTATIFKIAQKFLRDEETRLLQERMSSGQLLETITLLWSAKETLFKWHGKGGIDFRKHLHVQQVTGNNEEGRISASFEKENPVTLTLDYRIFEELLLTWTATPPRTG
ncbi:MAG TPA: 4'-phosphopantetheinyl transferase superfamily protein [Lacibacter sp.]|nr:4'-phosphopantetheinyl transferase superfamily protein [Lacibacter sp.]HMO89122.1 4'-phosphopantetheinyl transferase superfamily protein [Lacibacter sp.]HMP86657.1 4'-phosphopantetheinyl transferase superfamily protein [Lacibacter sp.]